MTISSALISCYLWSLRIIKNHFGIFLAVTFIAKILLPVIFQSFSLWYQLRISAFWRSGRIEMTTFSQGTKLWCVTNTHTNSKTHKCLSLWVIQDSLLVLWFVQYLACPVTFNFYSCIILTKNPDLSLRNWLPSIHSLKCRYLLQLLLTFAFLLCSLLKFQSLSTII